MLRKIALATLAAVTLSAATPALATDYLANTKSGKFHYATCRTIKHPDAPQLTLGGDCRWIRTVRRVSSVTAKSHQSNWWLFAIPDANLHPPKAKVCVRDRHPHGDGVRC